MSLTLTTENVEYTRDQLALVWDHKNFRLVVQLERTSRMLQLLTLLSKKFYDLFYRRYRNLALTEEISQVRVIQHNGNPRPHYSLWFPTIENRLFPSHPRSFDREFCRVDDKLWLLCSSTESHDCPINDRTDHIPEWYMRNMQTRFDIEGAYYDRSQPEVDVSTPMEAWDLSNGTQKPVIPEWMKPFNPHDQPVVNNEDDMPALEDTNPDSLERNIEDATRLLNPSCCHSRSSKFSQRVDFNSFNPGFDGGAWGRMPYTDEVLLNVPDYMLIRFFDTLAIYPRVKRLLLQPHSFFDQPPELTRSIFSRLRDRIREVLPNLRCIMLSINVDYYRVALFQARIVGQEIFGLMWHHPRVDPNVEPVDLLHDNPDEGEAVEVVI